MRIHPRAMSAQVFLFLLMYAQHSMEAPHPYNLITHEAEAGGLLQVQSQPGLHIEFHGSLATVKSCFNTKTNQY